MQSRMAGHRSPVILPGEKLRLGRPRRSWCRSSSASRVVSTVTITCDWSGATAMLLTAPIDILVPELGLTGRQAGSGLEGDRDRGPALGIGIPGQPGADQPGEQRTIHTSGIRRRRRTGAVGKVPFSCRLSCPAGATSRDESNSKRPARKAPSTGQVKSSAASSPNRNRSPPSGTVLEQGTHISRLKARSAPCRSRAQCRRDCSRCRRAGSCWIQITSL